MEIFGLVASIVGLLLVSEVALVSSSALASFVGGLLCAIGFLASRSRRTALGKAAIVFALLGIMFCTIRALIGLINLLDLGPG